MCPLRFFLVFLSAVLTGYFAWKTARSSQDSELMMVSENFANKAAREKQEFSCAKMMQNAFWAVVDMASGRYLWRNLKEMKGCHTNEESKREHLESS